MFNDNKDVLTAIKRQEESHLKMAIELGRVGNALVNIEKMMTKTLATYTAENIVLQTYPNTFAANGYLYNSLFVGDSAAADNAKLVIDGIVPQYTIPLVAGENAVNIPDQATYKVTTTSNKPVTALLTRYNTPGNNDTNVTFQGSLPAGANVIGNVGINGAIPTGGNTIGNVGLNAGTNIVGKVELLDSVGNTLQVAQSAGDGATGFTTLAEVPYTFNGTTYDRQRGNLPLTSALASAARTAATKSAAITNYNGKGVRVKLTVTAASGTGGLTVQVLDEASLLNVQATTAVTATGTYIYYVYPGISAGGTQALNGVIGRTFFINVNAGDASSYTYQVDYELIV